MSKQCILNATINRAGAILIFFCVTACSNMVPGMYLDTKYATTTTSGHPRMRPVIREITPDLIHAEQVAKTKVPAQDLSIFLSPPKQYLIGSGDLLSILVWDHPELSIATIAAQALSAAGAQTPAGFIVDQEGMIQFPYVGLIKLGGLTEKQARTLLMERLLKSIKNPDLTLRVQTYRSKRVYVGGEVKIPGNIAVDDVPMTLLEALTRAGGMLPTADESNLTIFRAGVAYPINLPLLLQHGLDPTSLLLTQGDVVRVINRDENKVYLLGEVNTPKALLMNNGRLTLTQALGEAGGLSQLSAAARKVYVIRNASTVEPIVYNLDARSPVAMALAENFELQPRDVVYVDASGLARFNRMISLIIPSSAAASNTITTLK